MAASAAALGSVELSRSAHAAGSDIIKVGMIGCGGRNAGAAAQALTADPGARLVAMCDIFRDRIHAKREEIKAARGQQVMVDDDHCFTGIRSGQPINCGDYMARSTMIAVMGQLSCYTGKEVTWEQVNQSDFFYPPKPEDCRDDMEPPTKPGQNGSYPVPVPGRTTYI